MDCSPPGSSVYGQRDCGLPFPSPGDLPDLEIEPESPALSGGFFTTEPPWKVKVKVKVKSLSVVRLFADPRDFSLPGSSVHGIFQAKILEWVAICSHSSPLDPGVCICILVYVLLTCAVSLSLPSRRAPFLQAGYV